MPRLNWANSIDQRPIFSISTRCSSVMPWVMPPGLAADFHAYLGEHAQDVALSRGGVGSDDEVWAAQGVEVGSVIGDVEGAVEQIAEQLGGARRGDVIDGVG